MGQKSSCQDWLNQSIRKQYVLHVVTVAMSEVGKGY